PFAAVFYFSSCISVGASIDVSCVSQATAVMTAYATSFTALQIQRSADIGTAERFTVTVLNMTYAGCCCRDVYDKDQVERLTAKSCGFDLLGIVEVTMHAPYRYGGAHMYVTTVLLVRNTRGWHQFVSSNVYYTGMPHASHPGL